jgi:phosphatidylglycerophosphate synthase
VAGRRVVDEKSRREAEWELCRGLAKSYQGPVDATVNWHFSMRLTREFAKTRITPNHITFLNVLVGLTASYLAWQGGWLMVAAAGLMMELQSILDSCDGELARLRFQYSKFGQWFDNISDDVIDNLFIAATSLAVGGWWAIIGVAGASARLFAAAVVYTDVFARTGTGDVYRFRWWFETDKQSSDEVYDPKAVMTWIRSLGRRDTYVFFWMFFCLANLPHGVAVWGAALGAIQGTMGLVHIVVSLGRRGGRSGGSSPR